MTAQSLRSILDKQRGSKSILDSQLSEQSAKRDSLKRDLPNIEEAQALLQKVAQDTQSQLQYHLEDIVNTGLETCFPETYNSHIDFILKRGKTECDIYLTDYQGNRVDPLQDNGGGLADIVAFSLRLACWTIGSSDNVLVFDEPFKFLSADLKPLAGELLQTLSKKMNLQILCVSHDESLIDIADKTFKIVKGNDEKSSLV